MDRDSSPQRHKTFVNSTFLPNKNRSFKLITQRHSPTQNPTIPGIPIQKFLLFLERGVFSNLFYSKWI